MVKNWTVALKLKLKLHLWGTLCLVKSLWFNKKKLTKNTFWFHGNFFNSTKIYRTKSCRKKIHNTLPLPYYFFISTHFFLLFTIFLDQFLLIQFQFFVVVCELNTAAYKHGRRLHRKSADFDPGSAYQATLLSFYETRLQKIRIVKVFSHCASFSIFVNHHPKCFVLCFKNTNPFLKRISSFLLCYFCANYI